jgi:hypothetical protein
VTALAADVFDLVSAIVSFDSILVAVLIWATITLPALSVAAGVCSYSDWMITTHVRCACGVVEVQLTGEPMAQYVCHTVAVTCGETGAFTLKTTLRTKCSRCGTYLFAEVPGYPFRGVNGHLLTKRGFKPEFHVQCRYAAARIEDDLPHYKDTPAKFRGSGELMSW